MPITSDMVGIDFMVTALVVVLVPGTGVIYTLSIGALQGGRASVAAAFGCTLGILPHLLASVFGLAALLHTSAVAFQTVKILGVVYLLYLAWGFWREASAPATAAGDGETRALRSHRPGPIAIRGILLNILNPKLSIFFLAFLPQFVPASAPDALARMTLLSAIFMGLTFVVFIGYGMAATVLRARVLSSARVMRWLNRSFAAVFAGFATKLALTDR